VRQVLLAYERIAITFTVYRELLETKLTDLERQFTEKTTVGRTVGAGSSCSTFPLTFKAQILREAAVEAAFLLHRNRPLSRGPFAAWRQAEEPGVAFEGIAAGA
jgi:hypothetical protein